MSDHPSRPPEPLRGQRLPIAGSGSGSVTRSHDDGCECVDCARRRNQLQPRRMKLAGGVDDVERISREDERKIARDVERKRALERGIVEAANARNEAEQRRRDNEIVQAVLDAHERLRQHLQGNNTSEARWLVNQARRMRPSLQKLLNR